MEDIYRHKQTKELIEVQGQSESYHCFDDKIIIFKKIKITEPGMYILENSILHLEINDFYNEFEQFENDLIEDIQNKVMDTLNKN
jgi:hypothetical protein